MRHTHREIEEAKMLSRRISAFQNVQVTPLSRLRAATTLLACAVITTLRLRVLASWRWLRDKHVCPKCAGRKHQLQLIDTDECVMRPCRLCAGKGEVDWQYVESYKWGQAAQRYRLAAGFSLAKAYYLCGLTPDDITRHEIGLVPLDD